MADRPMVNVYEGDPEVLVYREMNDDEYTQWQADQVVWEEEQNPPPTIDEKLAEALSGLSQNEPVTGADLANLISILKGQS